MICKRGHEGVPYVSPKGYAECRRCIRLRKQRHINKDREGYLLRMRERSKRYKYKSTSGQRYSADYFRRAVEKVRFSGLVDTVLSRDGFSCIFCGMSNEEHKARYDRRLTIDHIDGQGRYSREPNNDITNLQTLCLPCHGRKDKFRGLKKLSEVRL